MPIPVTCGKCNAQYNAPDGAAGKRAKCGKCGAAIIVPRGDGTADSAKAPRKDGFDTGSTMPVSAASPMKASKDFDTGRTVMQGVSATPQGANDSDFNVGKTIQAGEAAPASVEGLGEKPSPAQQQYLEACRMASRGGVVTPEARSVLDVLQKALSIDPAIAQAIEQCALGNVGAQTAKVAEFVALKTGTVLDNRYVITHLIGRGGMGAVYKAVDKEIESECAIKVLTPELAASAEAVASLRREVAIAQELTHQNLLRVNYLCTNSSPPFLVMEHIDGEDLETYRLRKGGKLSPDDFCHVATQILAGLTYLHDKGVVHLDIKPQNVMVAKTGEVKLTDFGIARTIKEQLASRDQSQVPMGTLCYMAPEQLRGEVCDLHADVYSLGILFHLLLAGKFPFPTTTREDVVAWHLGPEYAPDGVPREWSSLLRKCLARKPQSRFSSCAGIAAALQHEEPANHDGQADDKREEDSVEPIYEPAIVLDELSAHELHTDEEVALLFKPLYEQTTPDKETLQRVRARLTAWADSIPHHKFREFGATLSIREALHLPYYTLRLQTQYESRTVKRVEVPYTGWNLPELRVSEDNINVWSYSWPLTKDFKTGQEEHPIEDSQRLGVCGTCGGNGQVRCRMCGGTGRLRCPACGGSGQVQQSRPVQKWRTVQKYDPSTGQLGSVNEPYNTYEYYYVQCARCAASGMVTCHDCGGSGAVQCPTCNGSGRMVSLLVVTDSFGPEEDARIHANPRCTEDVRGLIDAGSHYRPVVSVLADVIRVEAIGRMDNALLQEAVTGVLISGQARCSESRRILKQRLVIGMADVVRVGYEFQGSSYDLRVAGKEWAVHAPMSRFVKLIENSVTWAREKLEAGKIADGLKMLERCFQMQQADDVVEGVFRTFRKRFADAYAHEAAKYGKWWAESLYYSDRAKQLEPAHSAALAHERAVLGRLVASTFAPGICAGTVGAIAGVIGDRLDVGVIGAITPLILSVLLWLLYGKQALNTIFVIALSVATAAIAGMTFYSIGTTTYPTEGDAWLYSGIAGLVLCVIGAGAAWFLPKRLRRERACLPKGIRESLSRAETLCQEDWGEIKASYRIGPFPALSGVLCAADRLELEWQIESDVADAKKVVLRAGDLRSHLQSVYKARLPIWRAAANNGIPSAQWLYGYLLEWGIGCDAAPEEAVAWFRKAAEQGDAAARVALGFCCHVGRGISQDKAALAEWCRMAAKQGYADAQDTLGWCYSKELGVAQDYSEAAKWFRKAAKQGHAGAQCRLGELYHDGNGVSKDDAKAVKWFRKSAEQGYKDAQFFLALSYEHGSGIPEDSTEAFRWMKMGAEQGGVMEQYLLGQYYYRGYGTRQNKAEAAKWLRKAAEQGFADARAELQKLGL